MKIETQQPWKHLHSATARAPGQGFPESFVRDAADSTAQRFGSRLPAHRKGLGSLRIQKSIAASLSRPISAPWNAAIRKPGACVSAQMGTGLVTVYVALTPLASGASAPSPETRSIADMI